MLEIFNGTGAPNAGVEAEAPNAAGAPKAEEPPKADEPPNPPNADGFSAAPNADSFSAAPKADGADSIVPSPRFVQAGASPAAVLAAIDAKPPAFAN